MKNPEGYSDPTASAAVGAATADEKMKEAKVRAMVPVISYIARLNGFRINGKIEFADENGRIFRWFVKG